MMKLTVTLALVLFACFLMVDAKDKTCPCVTTLEYDPQCGTDGNTYPNKGTVRCRNECNPKKPRVEIAHSGKCCRKTGV